MNKGRVAEQTLDFLTDVIGDIEVLDRPNLKPRCNQLEDGYHSGDAESRRIVDLGVTLLDHIQPEDFIPSTHQVTTLDTSNIRLIASQTHCVVCINVNVPETDGRIDLGSFNPETDISFSLGGDAMMPAFLLNLLGYNTALSSLVGTGKYGELYAEGMGASGIDMIKTLRESPQPIQINFSGRDKGLVKAIALYTDESVGREVRSRKYLDFDTYVRAHADTLRCALLGGAPADFKQTANRVYMGSEIDFLHSQFPDIVTLFDPKAMQQADGLREGMKSKFIKPNGDEVYVIDRCVVQGDDYSEIGDSRKHGKDYESDPDRIIGVHNHCLKKGVITPDQVWLVTLGGKGALYLQGNKAYRLDVPDMTGRVVSTQGCGNGALAGFMDGLMSGVKDPRELLMHLGRGGVASTLYLGNMGGTAADMQQARKGMVAYQVR